MVIVQNILCYLKHYRKFQIFLFKFSVEDVNWAFRGCNILTSPLCFHSDFYKRDILSLRVNDKIVPSGTLEGWSLCLPSCDSLQIGSPEESNIKSVKDLSAAWDVTASEGYLQASSVFIEYIFPPSTSTVYQVGSLSTTASQWCPSRSAKLILIFNVILSFLEWKDNQWNQNLLPLCIAKWRTIAIIIKPEQFYFNEKKLLLFSSLVALHEFLSMV